MLPGNAGRVVGGSTTGTSSDGRAAMSVRAMRSAPRRIAMLSVHTSPLDQPGTGDAGGMNVYIVELARRLTALGTEVEIFTRATRSDLPPGGGAGTRGAGPQRHRRPVRGAGQGGPARTAVCGDRRRAAGRGTTGPGPLRPGALALLAVRPGGVAGQGALGRAAGPLDAHHGEGQERFPRRGRHPRAGDARDRRDPGGRGRRPPRGQHGRGGGRTRPALRRGSRQGGRGRARRRLGALRPRLATDRARVDRRRGQTQ